MEQSGPVCLAIAVLTPLLLFNLQQRKGFVSGLAFTLPLTLPLLPSYFLLHAQLRSPFLRAFLCFTFCWAIPNRLLLLCFHSLDLPPWSFSHPSHFLLSILLPIRIKGPCSPVSPHLLSHLRLLLFELSALVFAGCCLAFVPVDARYPFFFLTGFLTLDLPSRAAAIAFHVLYQVELHETFNSPWLPYSLTELWGRQWNSHANALLRQSVYNPIIAHLSARKARSKGAGEAGAADEQQQVELWVRIVGVCATFLFSGLLHEFGWFCILQKRRRGSWENTWFFVLHGLATSAEISCRRLLPGLSPKIPRLLKLALTLTFFHTTMAWLLFAPRSAMPNSGVPTFNILHHQ